MPSNPFHQPEFWTTAARVGALIIVAWIAVGLLEWSRHRPLAKSVLVKRVLSWSVIAPIYIVALFIGGFPVFLMAAFVVLQGTTEYARLVGLERRYAMRLMLGSLLGLVVASGSVIAARYLIFAPLIFFMWLTLLPILYGKVQKAHYQIGATLFGYLYIGFPMAYFVFIKGAESWGRSFLLIVGVAVALSDVSAFIVGSILKGPKLAPSVSPNKTWAGLGGNILGAALGVLLMSNLISKSWGIGPIVVLTIAIGLGAVWGDLTESFVKRDYAVKDAGTLLPGFGGILDRADSLLMALPFSYLAFLIASHPRLK